MTPRDDVTPIWFSTRRSRIAGYGVYVFLTRDVMIDTAFHAVRRDVARLLNERRPRGVVLTHHHEDHAGNIELAAGRGIPVLAAPMTLHASATHAPIGLYRRFVWSPMPLLRSAIEPFLPEGLELIHTPGHSPDHHVIWDAERAILFAGDLFLAVKVRVARPGENPRSLADSLRRAAALGPKRMFDAHRGEVPNPVTGLRAKAAWLDETIGRIDHAIDAGHSDESIRDQILGREEWVSYVSRGDLCKLNFARAVRASRRAPETDGVAPGG
jgi:glyoxylase-like metal-dependent hydrolase (beta-lactamase superfamily II)